MAHPAGSAAAAVTPTVTPTVGRDSRDAVLVLRALGLGDAATGIAALRGVRRAWPDRFIALAAPAVIGQWLRDLGIIDEVLPTVGLDELAWPPPGWLDGGGHIAVDLHGRGPLSHRVLLRTAPAQLIGFRCPPAGHLSGPSWRPDEHEVDRWCRLISRAGGPCGRQDLLLRQTPAVGGQVVVHPGAASGSRRWPAERWSTVVDRLHAGGHPIVVTGSPAERELCRAVAHGPQPADAPNDPAVRVECELDLAQLTEIIGGAALLISGDTGVAHLATALRVRSVLLFGPTPPASWGPAVDDDLHTVLWHGNASRPGDPHGATIDPALNAVSVQEVLTAARAQLSTVSSWTPPAAVQAETPTVPTLPFRPVVPAHERTSPQSGPALQPS